MIDLGAFIHGSIRVPLGVLSASITSSARVRVLDF